jgi:hypothetical protein
MSVNLTLDVHVNVTAQGMMCEGEIIYEYVRCIFKHHDARHTRQASHATIVIM